MWEEQLWRKGRSEALSRNLPSCSSRRARKHWGEQKAHERKPRNRNGKFGIRIRRMPRGAILLSLVHPFFHRNEISLMQLPRERARLPARMRRREKAEEGEKNVITAGNDNEVYILITRPCRQMVPNAILIPPLAAFTATIYTRDRWRPVRRESAKARERAQVRARTCTRFREGSEETSVTRTDTTDRGGRKQGRRGVIAFRKECGPRRHNIYLLGRARTPGYTSTRRHTGTRFPPTTWI